MCECGWWFVPAEDSYDVPPIPLIGYTGNERYMAVITWAQKGRETPEGFERVK